MIFVGEEPVTAPLPSRFRALDPLLENGAFETRDSGTDILVFSRVPQTVLEIRFRLAKIFLQFL